MVLFHVSTKNNIPIEYFLVKLFHLIILNVYSFQIFIHFLGANLNKVIDIKFTKVNTVIIHKNIRGEKRFYMKKENTAL